MIQYGLLYGLGLIAGWFFRQAEYHRRMSRFHSGMLAFMQRYGRVPDGDDVEWMVYKFIKHESIPVHLEEAGLNRPRFDS